jgi:four helix bundle protein
MNPPSKVFRFEKLDVWQKARLLNKDINEVTKRFPSSELYALTSQIRRASISVSSNIAEGAGRNSDADFARFLEIAYGSLMEVVSQLYLALDEKYLTQELLSEILEKADILAAQIAALSKSLGRTPRSLKQ